MGYIGELVEDLKIYINKKQNASLDIDVNKMSAESQGDPNKASFGMEYVKNNLSDSFEWIESGTTRDVYRITTNRYGADYQGKVIKFARTNNRRMYNKREMQTWTAVKSSKVGSYFCPIRLCDPHNSWLIMDNAEICLDREDAKHIRNIIDERTTKNSLDIHYNNIGIHSERGKVLVDYSWGADFRIDSE